MRRLDETRPFVPVNIAILTVSDRRTLETDTSGQTLVDRAEAAGHNLAARAIVTDEQAKIRAQVQAWIDDPAVDCVISTGGTGVTGRDVTPEAFEGLYEKRIDGFGEAFRWISFQKIGTSAMQSRATAGVAGGTYLLRSPVQVVPAGTAGMRYWSINWITASGPAISLRLCPACRSMCSSGINSRRCMSPGNYACLSVPLTLLLSLQNDPDRMDDAGDVPQDRQQDIEPKVTANSHLKKHAERRQ